MRVEDLLKSMDAQTLHGIFVNTTFSVPICKRSEYLILCMASMNESVCSTLDVHQQRGLDL